MLYVRDVSCAGGAGGRGRDVGRERTREEGMWVVGGTAEGGWAMGEDPVSCERREYVPHERSQV